jgi:hypothetical protein
VPLFPAFSLFVENGLYKWTLSNRQPGVTIATFRLLIMNALDLARIASGVNHAAEPVCMSPIQSELFLIAEKSVQGKIKISMIGMKCES